MLTAHRVCGGVLRPEEASYMNLILRMARRVLPSRLALMGAASAGTLGLVGLVALAGAAIPSSDGKINGCYDKSTGNLRVIDEAKVCKVSEVSISWNQVGRDGEGIPGPTGATGPEGPVGPTGPKGEDGTSGAGLSDLNDLNGLTCTHGGAPGEVVVTYSEEGLISLACVGGGCDDDDFPDSVVNLPFVYGDVETDVESVEGMICPGERDVFFALVSEQSELDRILEAMVRVTATSEGSLRLTVIPADVVPSSGNLTVGAPAVTNGTTPATVSVTMPDAAADPYDCMHFLIVVEGATPTARSPYQLMVAGGPIIIN